MAGIVLWVSVGLAVVGLAGRLSDSWSPRSRLAPIAVLLVLVLTASGSLASALSQSLSIRSRLALALVGGVFVVVAVLLVYHRTAATAARYLVTAAAVYLLIAVVTYGVKLGWRHSFTTWPPSPTARDAGLPAEPPPQAHRGVPRDIYVVILDEYARSDVLTLEFEFGHPALAESLSALGFEVPSAGRSNYPWTIFSVASMLNLDYLDGLAATIGVRSTDWRPLSASIYSNRLFRLARARGYRVYFIPSAREESTEHFLDADAVPGGEGLSALDKVWRAWHYVGWTWTSTLPGYLLDRFGIDLEGAARVDRPLTLLQRAPSLPGPKLVFAHLMVTHPPFELDSLCNPVRGMLAFPLRAYIRSYRSQVACTNRVVLEFVHRALGGVAEKPAIIIQADHGVWLRAWREGLTPEALAERFAAFAAYYLPDSAGRVFSDTVTPVNAFRYVASAYFGAGLAPLPDRSFFAVQARPYRYTAVDIPWLR